jgi:nicotinamide mononucleotide adenylyltransferase
MEKTTPRQALRAGRDLGLSRARETADSQRATYWWRRRASGLALYRHFSGKDEILAALFNEALDELLSATAMVYEDLSPRTCNG